ncbi:MAG TPA: hypothetical protein VMT94_08485 [Burkholderiales bacterium]|nr:hypothetical protein [Burkholderiales bacterium]
MRTYLLALLLLGIGRIACAADDVNTNNGSPFDSNPDCMDRKVDSNSRDCVLQDNAKPMHLRPPAPQATTPPASSVAPVAPVTPSPTLRTAPSP